MDAAANSERPPLLVVHGSGGGFDQGLAIGTDYAARGWCVIAPSRFGYLRTPWPDAPGDNVGAAQADHLACLLDALGVASVTVLGVSAGAIAAAEFAVRHPQRTQALVLMVPAGCRPETAPPFPAWAQRVLEATISADLPFWLAARFAPDAVRGLVLATPPSKDAPTACCAKSCRSAPAVAACCTSRSPPRTSRARASRTSARRH